jgi:hypothetical protein
VRRALAAACVLAVVVAVAAAASGASSDRGAAQRAARWVAGQLPGGGDGTAADAIVVLRATGQLPRADAIIRAKLLRAGVKKYLASDVTPAGPAAKVILGLTAAGVGNPRCAGSLDLLRALRSGRRKEFYGADAFDEGFSLLALRALHQPVAPRVIGALRASRHGGGWPLALGSSGADDTESTAILLEGLNAAGVGVHDPMMRSALTWLASQRDAAGGFGDHPGEAPDADTTGVVLTAENALGVADPRAVAALKGLQRPSGAIQYEATDPGSLVLATLDGALALSGAKRPVGAGRSTPVGC